MAEDEFARPIVTVDIVLLTLHEGRLCVALLPRSAEPFACVPALIGGYVHTDEDVDAEAAVRRILKAKAGLEGIFFEQLGTFASARRDPRDWSVSIAYFALVPQGALAGGTSPLELRLSRGGRRTALRPQWDRHRRAGAVARQGRILDHSREAASRGLHHVGTAGNL